MIAFLLLILALNANAFSTPAVTRATIIGAGRIGSLLHQIGGQTDKLITRDSGEKVDADGNGPVYVCTRNDDLASIVEACPEGRREDLVFLQNGMLDGFLRRYGLQDNTQGLIYFAVSKLGEAPIDGKTSLNPNGLTAASGKWGEDLTARLQSANLTCHVLEKDPFRVAMIEKHIWICAFMAVGADHGGVTVGEVLLSHEDEVRTVIAELAASATYETGLTFTDDLADRLCAYGQSVAHFPTALKEFKWRNGWFAAITMKRASRLLPDLSPKHSDILSGQKPNLMVVARRQFVGQQKADATVIAPLWLQARALETKEREVRLRERARNPSPPADAEVAALTSSPTLGRNRDRLLRVAAIQKELAEAEKDK